MTDLPVPEKRVWLKHPSLRIGAIASLVFLLIGFVSIAWVPYPIEVINVGAAMQDPSPAHWLGTDHLGRDMLSMIMKGTLTSFVVAYASVAWLLRFVAHHSIGRFVPYRVALGLVLLGLLATGAMSAT